MFKKCSKRWFTKNGCIRKTTLRNGSLTVVVTLPTHSGKNSRRGRHGIIRPCSQFCKNGGVFSQTGFERYKRQCATLQMKKKMIRKPASVIIAGPSGSGKSELVEQLLKEKTLFYRLVSQARSLSTWQICKNN